MIPVEGDRRFRPNVTGANVGSALFWFYTMVGHVGSIYFSWVRCFYSITSMVQGYPQADASGASNAGDAAACG